MPPVDLAAALSSLSGLFSRRGKEKEGKKVPALQIEPKGLLPSIDKIVSPFLCSIVVMDGKNSAIRRRNSTTKRQWTKQEDAALVNCFVEIANDPTLKGENGFKTGYLLRLEKMLHLRFSGTNIKATPHIKSRYKLLKKHFLAIQDMLNKGSGFSWNDVEKCVTVSKDVFDDWVKVK
nr:Myb_DNA-bind_3 domain-containing protein [Ipomoea batatas]